MLRIAVLCLALFCSLDITIAQESGVLYYDRKWAPTDDLDEAAYARSWERINDTLYLVKDAYHPTGVMQMKGYSTDYREMRGKTGLFHYYHGNGRMHWEVPYVAGQRHGTSQTWYPGGERSDSGAFTNGARTGFWRWWHPNGRLKSEGEYVASRREGEWNEWYANGTLQRTGRFDAGRSVGTHREYHSNGTIAGEAVYSAPGVGVAKWFDRDGTLRGEEQIVGDSVIGGVYYSDNDRHTDPGRGFVVPVPVGMDDEEEFIDYLTDNLKYPEISRREGHGGEVAIAILIDEDGNLDDAYVARSATEMLDAEALRVISALKKWKPARVSNREAYFVMMVPIVFKLED